MIEEDELPEDWKVKKLGDIAKFQNGNDFSKSQWEDKGRPIIRIQNLTGTGDSYNYYSGEVDDRYSVERGDILFAWSGTIDAFRWYGEDAWLNQHIYKVIPDEQVTEDYTYRLLKNAAKRLEKKKVGSGLQHIRKSHVEGLDVPVPPLDEQERIVEAVEERLERVERLEKTVENVGRLADEYEDSFVTSLMLDNMSGYSGELPSDDDLPSDWSMSKISEVTSVNGNYTYPEDEFPEQEFNYISVSEVDGGTGRIVDAQQLLGKECSTRARRKISKDDVILSTVRPYLKAFALVPEEYDGAIASTAFAVLTAGDDIEPEYLYRAVRSPLFVNQLKSKQKGASYPEVRLSEVKESVIPVPPKDKQMEIVEKLDKIDFGLLEKSVSDVEGLFVEYRSSILAHAFQGDIDY